MHQCERAGRFPVSDEGDLSSDIEFKSMTVLVVAEIVGHAQSIP
jgi:hypothetical protein